ncbi:hypothetical protein OK016_24065 [Vibrio chagasii]|nr:hypothetical protein [Vibrio chagasii]
MGTLTGQMLMQLTLLVPSLSSIQPVNSRGRYRSTQIPGAYVYTSNGSGCWNEFITRRHT